jgi:hypothetical protein
MDREKLSNHYTEPSIDASYQIQKNQNPVHLAEGFQRRLKCEKVSTTSDGKSSRCLWQGELKTTYNAPLRMVD